MPGELDLSGIVRRLEQERGSPVEIEIRTPQQGYARASREVHGSFQDRPCEVAPLPTKDTLLNGDLELLRGEYASLKELDKRIESLAILHHHQDQMPRDAFEGLHDELKQKYGTQKMPNGAECIRGLFSPYAYLREGNPLLYQDIVNFLRQNRIPFLNNWLGATPIGVHKLRDGDCGEREFGEIVAEVRLRRLDR